MNKHFKNVKDDIAIVGQHDLDKFCGLCGHKLRGRKDRLKRHLKGQHDSVEGAFLKFGELPLHSKYTNFQDYLADPSTPLVERD